MRCPFCAHYESKVTDKRASGDYTRRRRECLKCNKRFTTYERFEPIEISVIKKSGKRESFNIEKLRGGIQKACEKRDVNPEKVDKIINEALEKFKRRKEIPSNLIGEFVMRKLKKIDKVAYIRFASVYKDFKDVEDFREISKEIKK